MPNGHGNYAAPDNETRHARFPDGTASHSTRLSKNDNQVAGYKQPKDGCLVVGFRLPDSYSWVIGYTDSTQLRLDVGESGLAPDNHHWHR